MGLIWEHAGTSSQLYVQTSGQGACSVKCSVSVCVGAWCSEIMQASSSKIWEKFDPCDASKINRVKTSGRGGSVWEENIETEKGRCE